MKKSLNVVKEPLVFIASPVTDPDERVKNARVEEAVRFGAWVLDTEQKNVYVAALNDDALNRYRQTSKTLAWWKENMKVFMETAEACYVLCLPGWEASSGVRLEAEVAQSLGKPVFHYNVLPEGGFVRA